MRRILRIARPIAHGAALVFGAFWLVATSAGSGPAETCFTEIHSPVKLAVTLGTPLDDRGGVQSCDGIDGLTAGATIVMTMSQGPRPEVGGAPSCWGYKTDGLDGPTDVSDIGSADAPGEDLTVVWGTYSSSASAGCRGGWTMWAGPNVVQFGTELSPLDLTAGQGWHVRRSMNIDQAQFCDGVFAGSGPVACADRFPVVDVAEVAP